MSGSFIFSQKFEETDFLIFIITQMTPMLLIAENCLIIFLKDRELTLKQMVLGP